MLTSSKGLTITNPIVLYRALLATKQIDPDPAQHRLALQLQKLYYRLKDYSPEIEYRHKLNQLTRVVEGYRESSSKIYDIEENAKRKGIFSSIGGQREEKGTLAITKRLTDHESAINLQSPQGMLLYGEVGTGKSMLVDLLADCLPNQKKRRWHFNTFMLETFASLEELRRKRLGTSNSLSDERYQNEEYPLLWLARNMISTSPVLFLDEFQLPDRVASKILSNLFTSFFHLGGVLIATSNRMPEELANASGIDFAAPPPSSLGHLVSRWGLLGSSIKSRNDENKFSGKGDFAAFLDVLRARCEIWNMDSERDWRRREIEDDDEKFDIETEAIDQKGQMSFDGLEPMASGNWGLGYEQSKQIASQDTIESSRKKKSVEHIPKHYFVRNSSLGSSNDTLDVKQKWEIAVASALPSLPKNSVVIEDIPWESTFLKVYGRHIRIHRALSGITYWTFPELCSTNLGPADYISLASKFHTLILTDVPILTLTQKNEARRFITLLDALYEARCKLLIQAEADPDSLFFPETHHHHPASSPHNPTAAEGVYPETFSEIYQDSTAPFRPNISPYTPSASPPSYFPSPRSILADEDSDFGPLPNPTGRSPRGPSNGIPGAGHEHGQPNFTYTEAFTGEDERFAYKRARSRLWEMCGARWWAREEAGWWRPVAKEARRWEGDGVAATATGRRPIETETTDGESMFRHGASPFRVSEEPPPRFSWTHAWGMMRWGRKAGVWGKGVEGLGERRGEGGGGGGG